MIKILVEEIEDDENGIINSILSPIKCHEHKDKSKKLTWQNLIKECSITSIKMQKGNTGFEYIISYENECFEWSMDIMFLYRPFETLKEIVEKEIESSIHEKFKSCISQKHLEKLKFQFQEKFILIYKDHRLKLIEQEFMRMMDLNISLEEITDLYKHCQIKNVLHS